MGKYEYVPSMSDASQQKSLVNISNELVEISRILKLLVKLKIEEHGSSVLDKEGKRTVDLNIYKKDLEDQA